MSTLTKLLESTQTNSPTPTNAIDNAKNTINHLSPVQKIAIAAGVGIILLGIIAGIAYCCYKRRRGTVTVRPGQRVNMLYELGELSNRRNRRR